MFSITSTNSADKFLIEKQKVVKDSFQGLLNKESTNTQTVLKMSMCVFFINKFICDFLQFFKEYPPPKSNCLKDFDHYTITSGSKTTFYHKLFLM